MYDPRNFQSCLCRRITPEVVLENYQLIEDETWEPERTYIVNNTLEIPQDVTLNIPPGTTVKFGPQCTYHS